MTQKVIGPTFLSELEAHGGLIGQHFTWQSNGTIEFFDDTPKNVIDGVKAVYAAHNPNSLAWSKSQRVAALSQECANAITAGFTSSALGAAYSYPARATDQQNLASSVLASLMPGLPSTWQTPFWCADASGVWAFRVHTAAQIQQVGQDGKAAILAAMTKNQTLTDKVNAITLAAGSDGTAEIAAVNAITW